MIDESNISESEDDEFELQPLDPETDSYRQMIMQRHDPVPPLIVEPEPPKYQFSILSIAICTFCVAIVAGLCQLVAPNIIAGVFGLVTLFSLMVVILIGQNRPKLQMAWVFLVVVYIVFAIVAAYRS